MVEDGDDNSTGTKDSGEDDGLESSGGVPSLRGSAKTLLNFACARATSDSKAKQVEKDILNGIILISLLTLLHAIFAGDWTAYLYFACWADSWPLMAPGALISLDK